jgi:uncharacterized SAM-binding protein YcdF (DUF218 family)
MTTWVLKGPGPEIAERRLAVPPGEFVDQPAGLNTWEEATEIVAASQDGDTVYVVTSAYHVARAYLTLQAALRAAAPKRLVLHVWGTGTVTNIQLASESQKLAEAQAKGHALRWDEL